MNTYISILRGINVGGKRKILMADLKAIYEDLGFKNIITYIQSGNVIFQASKQSYGSLEEDIKKSILDKTGLEVPVILRTAIEMKGIVENNPFLKQAENDLTKLHVTFLDTIPNAELIRELEILNSGKDEFSIQGNNIYIYCDDGYGKTKLNNNLIEKVLQTSATTRNWRTVCKIANLSIE